MTRRASIAAIAGLAAVDLGWLAFAAMQGQFAAGFGIVHALATIAALTLLARQRRLYAQPGGSVLWIAAAVGPAGLLAAMLAMPALASLEGRLQLSGPAPAEDDAKPSVSLARIRDARIVPPEPVRLGSLMNAMRHGDVADRQAAIETAVRSFEPRLSPVILRALVDRDQTIRALAASASTRILHQLSSRRARLERGVADHDDADSRLALAAFLAEHGHDNALVSQAQRERLCDAAADALEAVLQRLALDDPRRETAVAALIRIRPDAAIARSSVEADVRRLYRARDMAGVARRLSMPDAEQLVPDHAFAHILALWRAEAAA